MHIKIAMNISQKQMIRILLMSRKTPKKNRPMNHKIPFLLFLSPEYAPPAEKEAASKSGEILVECSY
nr:hypothetical protein [Candidatus Mycoplasma haematolamae]